MKTQLNFLKKLVSFIDSAVTYCLVGVLAMLFTTPNVTAGDHGDYVGHKKIFLRQNCKEDPAYVCHLRGDNTPRPKEKMLEE